MNSITRCTARSSTEAESPYRALRNWLAFAIDPAACAATGIFLLAHCAGAAAQTGPPPAVSVTPVVSREVTEADEFIGRVTAIDKVDIVARVPGYIEQRYFSEGQPVKTGDLLFRIEQATYKAAVDQQRANLAKAKANEVNAALQLARSRELVRNQNISQATVDQRTADEQAAQADIMESQAALDQAQINLGYTEIRSPVDGRIGIANFTTGNLVSPSSGALATIVSQDPIYVIFQASERDILDYQRRASTPGGQKGPIPVHLKLADGSLYPEVGYPNFLGIQVDPTTDTVSVRAQMPNPKGVLIPGAVVTVSVQRGSPRLSLLVPQAAISVDQAGRYVLVVGPDKKVELRRVTVGSEQGSDVVVTEGLREGELVIVEGIQKVRPGQLVDAAVAKAN